MEAKKNRELIFSSIMFLTLLHAETSSWVLKAIIVIAYSYLMWRIVR